jgi:predicted glycoside hydrolase/deacetylase ChbG (UPF0249 family)
MSFLIVNADDFGYSFSINKGIIEAHTKGIVTSTSVMVDAIAAKEAKDLVQYPDLTIGLHLQLDNLDNVETELQRQVDKFITIVDRKPDHIDTHKRHTTDEGIESVLREYSKSNNIPVRNFGVKHIGSSGINTGDPSIGQLKKSVDEAAEQYNELMTHCGYSDDNLREHSSYSEPREQELEAICDPAIKSYIAQKELVLCNWRTVSAKPDIV